MKLIHSNILTMEDYSCYFVEREGEDQIMVSGYYEYIDWDLRREID